SNFQALVGRWRGRSEAPGVLSVYVIASFGALRGTIDGGPLDFATLLSSVVLLTVLVWGPGANELRRIGAVWTLIPLHLAWSHVWEGSATATLRSLFLLALLGLVGGAPIFVRERRWKDLAALLGAFAAVAVATRGDPYLSESFRYLYQPVAKGDEL